MTTMYIDDSAHSAFPPPIPPIVAPAPRPLGVWRALAWLGLAAIAALAAIVVYTIVILISNVVPRGRPTPLPLEAGRLAAGLAAFFTVIILACRCAGWRAAD